MNYNKIYIKLVDRALKRHKCNDTYYEQHHIIPKCANGYNNNNNLVFLTAREHYVAHGLLVKIYKDTEFYCKMICAFRYMSVDSHGGRRVGKDYAWMRKLYSENHPMKDPQIAQKAHNNQKLYYKNLSDEERKQQSIRKSKGLRKYFDNLTIEDHQKLSIQAKIIQNRPEVNKKRSDSLKLFYKNETTEQYKARMLILKNTALSDEANQKRSKTWKEKLSNMSKEELTKHVKRSFGSCDHKARGNAISLGKKGKKTNQPQIERERYGKMSEEKFEEYIKNRKLGIQIRMRNRRNEYLNEHN